MSSVVSNLIDLTVDDGEETYGRSAKRPRLQNPTALAPQQVTQPIIDLTTEQPHSTGLRLLPADTHPKTPVCIGQLLVKALVLYPVPYITHKYHPNDLWAPVRLQYEHTPNGSSGLDTIHIITPPQRAPTGEVINGDRFAYIEPRVANGLGGLLGRGLIRLDAKIGKPGRLDPNVSISSLPLQMLVYTPKGNIQAVGNYLQQNHLFLEDPAPPYDAPRLANYFYFNPHKVQFNPMLTNRWSVAPVAGKSVEVQRNQVEELFKDIRSGEDLDETEPGPQVATKLYPHQKKALTFLLEREREKPSTGGKLSSLWQKRIHPVTGASSWMNIVTQTEGSEEPKESKGAILADDMGLGKTISCVSLIAATLSSAQAFAQTPLDIVEPPPPPPQTPHWAMQISPPAAKAIAQAQRLHEKLETEYLRVSRIKVRSRATLIICPLSTVANWEDQFKEHWNGQVISGSNGCQASTSQNTDNSSATMSAGTALRLYVYHGHTRRPEPSFLADFDAVITTYATLASEYSKQTRSTVLEEEDEGTESDGVMEIDQYGNQIVKVPPPKPKKSLKRKVVSNGVEATSALQSVHWFRVVLDEAHCIKEAGTVASRASCDLIADRRLCLTGTPVQNKLDDVFALVKFLRLSPIDEKAAWTEYIGNPVKYQQEVGFIRLQTLMKCITLRRTKETKDKTGKRILALPPRKDELRYLKFDEHEQTIYNQFFTESKAEFTELSNKNEVMKNYVGILQKILRLRQICDHFDLVKGKGPQEIPSYEETISAIEREGFNATRAIAIFTILKESAPIQCVECNADLCTVGEAQQEEEDVEGTPKRGKKGKASRTSTRANSPSLPRIVITRCPHMFCLDCFRTSVCPGWPEIPPDTCCSCSACNTELCFSDAVEIKPELVTELAKKKATKREKRQKGVPLEFNPSTKIKSLLTDLIQFSRTNPYSSNYDPSSIEVQMVDDQGNDVDDGVVKTVVFSQWTSMLDKIEDALETAGIRYDRLDGTMKRDDRSRAIDALKRDPACEVLLVSLKAGGVGLNLTAAQRVYIMDPYWNPAVENQAVDRIHRLGQTRPVTTIKFVIENSIEARLLEVQKKKTDLANMTLGNNYYTKAELQARRLEDLQQLFQDTS